jgi:hypothetical protein
VLLLIGAAQGRCATRPQPTRSVPATTAPPDGRGDLPGAAVQTPSDRGPTPLQPGKLCAILGQRQHGHAPFHPRATFSLEQPVGQEIVAALLAGRIEQDLPWAGTRLPGFAQRGSSQGARHVFPHRVALVTMHPRFDLLQDPCQARQPIFGQRQLQWVDNGRQRRRRVLQQQGRHPGKAPLGGAGKARQRLDGVVKRGMGHGLVELRDRLMLGRVGAKCHYCVRHRVPAGETQGLGHLAESRVGTFRLPGRQ